VNEPHNQLTEQAASGGRDGTPPLLRLRNVSKSFGPVQALDGVDFEVRAGEVMALVCDNGAGKSTLVKTVSGILRPTSGEILFREKPVELHSPADAAEIGIVTVYQDLALCDNLDVIGNLFLGRSVKRRIGPFKVLDPVAMEQRTLKVLASLGVTTVRNVRAPVATLSGGQRQSVAVARAVMWHSRVVLLDEPTAALGVEQTAQVLSLVKRLRDENLGVVLISHNLADVFAVADRITVLRLGKDVASFDAADVTEDEVVAAITRGAPK
jgi:D-xylose transport system ATP-binding protein